MAIKDGADDGDNQYISVRPPNVRRVSVVVHWKRVAVVATRPCSPLSADPSKPARGRGGWVARRARTDGHNTATAANAAAAAAVDAGRPGSVNGRSKAIIISTTTTTTSRTRASRIDQLDYRAYSFWRPHFDIRPSSKQRFVSYRFLYTVLGVDNVLCCRHELIMRFIEDSLSYGMKKNAWP